MKKQSGSRIARVFNRVINVRAWADLDRMKEFTKYVVDAFKNTFIPQKIIPAESFQEAQLRQKITNDQLLIRQNALKRLSYYMLFAASLIFIYALYHLLYGTWQAFLVSLVVTFIALVMSFRYHFWYFQIKKRKLGCTIGEWYQQGILGKHDE